MKNKISVFVFIILLGIATYIMQSKSALANDDLTVFKMTHVAIAETELYTVFEMPFKRNGLKIYGELFMPNVKKESYPLIVLAHGLRGSYYYSANYAQYFANAGIASYVFDFQGGSEFSKSEGSFKEMSVLTEKEDLNIVLNGLQAFSFLNHSQVFLMGESQGGLVASLLAVERQEEIRGLVLIYPAFMLPDYARDLYKDKNNIPDNPVILNGEIGKRYFTDIFDIYPYEIMEEFEKPVYIFHGDNDTIVSLEHSIEAQKRFKNAKLKIMHGLGHAFYGEYLYDVCTDIINFVNENIK